MVRIQRIVYIGYMYIELLGPLKVHMILYIAPISQQPPQSNSHHVDNPYCVNKTPIFGKYVVWCGSKNKYQKYMCLKDISIHAHNILTILRSIVNIIREGPTWPFNEHKNIFFENKLKTLIWASSFYFY